MDTGQAKRKMKVNEEVSLYYSKNMDNDIDTAIVIDIKPFF